MRIALAQINPLVGDLAGNGARILVACQEAAAAHADLVVTPELSLWGYPPRDLLLRPALLSNQQEALDQLAAELAATQPSLAVLVGVAEPIAAAEKPNLFNAVALVSGGQWRIVARKQLLPTYDVFDERRYFRAADQPAVLEFQQGGRSWTLGLTICEDLWVEEELQGHRLAGPDPVAALQPHRIDVLLNLSASPFGQAKAALRHRLAARATQKLQCPVVYVNQVGGNDELVFDGASFVVDASGKVAAQLACCQEQVAIWETPRAGGSPEPPGTHLPTLGLGLNAPLPEPQEQLFRALALGVRDYAKKCGFRRVLLGLSGGIDSALVAVVGAAALGAEQVQALLLPSPYSSEGSISDATALVERLGMAAHTLPIAPLMAGFDAALAPALDGAPHGLTAENLQSRIRGCLLMAVANQQGHLLLSTGN